MMRAVALLVAVGAFAAACSGGSDANIADLEASGVQEDTVAAMDELSSYKVEISVDDSAVLTVDFGKPNQYRTVAEAGPSAGDHSPSVGELLFVGESVFVRQCDGVYEGCEPWEERPRDGAILGGSPANFPQWPIVALEMASDLTLDVDGDELVVRGSVNLLRAVLENEHGVAEEGGITAFGRECTTSFPPLVGDGTPRQIELQPTEVCRDTTYEDMLEQEADDIVSGDANPASIEVRIDPETYLVREFVAVNPPQDNDSPSHTLRFVYSDYNDVTIEVPEEFR